MTDNENTPDIPDMPEIPEGMPEEIKALLGAILGGDLGDKIGDDNVTVINGDDMPDEFKEALSKFADKAIKKSIDSAERKLDRFVGDFNQACTDDEDGPGMEPYQAMATLGHHVGEHSDMPRSVLSVLFGVAIGKIARMESRVMDLELELAGHPTAA